MISRLKFLLHKTSSAEDPCSDLHIKIRPSAPGFNNRWPTCNFIRSNWDRGMRVAICVWKTWQLNLGLNQRAYGNRNGLALVQNLNRRRLHGGHIIVYRIVTGRLGLDTSLFLLVSPGWILIGTFVDTYPSRCEPWSIGSIGWRSGTAGLLEE